jgi:hypothetical protein
MPAIPIVYNGRIVHLNPEVLSKGPTMARETMTRLVDDLDGSDAQETVKFALDGRSYEIDLSTKNAAKLRTTLATYVENGTRVARTSSTGGRRTGGTASSPEDTRDIRMWAEQQGYEVASRGRLSQDLIDLYRSRKR